MDSHTKPASKEKKKSNQSAIGSICFLSVAFTPAALSFYWDELDPFLGSLGWIPDLWLGVVIFIHFGLMTFTRSWAIAFSKDKTNWEKTQREGAGGFILSIPIMILVIWMAVTHN